MRVNGILSFLSFCDVCSDDCRDRIATFFEELAHLFLLEKPESSLHRCQH